MIKNVSAEEAWALIDKGARIIDIRDKKEFNKKSVRNSINIDIGKIDTINEIYPEKDDTFIVICASGIRSIAVAEEMSDLGYRNVYNLFGGFKSLEKF